MSAEGGGGGGGGGARRPRQRPRKSAGGLEGAVSPPLGGVQNFGF